jgi:hypothetical protein
MLFDRRNFLNSLPLGLGTIALSTLLAPNHSSAGDGRSIYATDDGALSQLHHRPRAKRVIFLFQSGGPSQHDLFDYKPLLNQRHGEQLPESVRAGQRLTGMSGYQASLPLAGSPFQFARHGESGTWISELLPYTAKIADELCVIRSVFTEAINHGPGTTFLQTGSQLPGRPSIGAWLSYGLGSQNTNLPSFVVLVTNKPADQPLQVRLWGSGFLPSKHEGVRLMPGDSPVLYLNSPPGIAAGTRRNMLDALSQMHQLKRELQPEHPDPILEARIAHFELGFRMQQAIPEATDLSDEPESTFEEYGPDAKQPGSFAANCILARRLAERGVQFIQLYHPGMVELAGIITTICRDRFGATAGKPISRQRLWCWI